MSVFVMHTELANIFYQRLRVQGANKQGGKNINKRVYISADYSENDGDRDVVDVLKKWGSDDLHKISFVDTAAVNSGSVAKYPDCRLCDLKQEFNQQINVSSYVIVVIGAKTKTRTAGNQCYRQKLPICECTPYKQNANGTVPCKVRGTIPSYGDDVSPINEFSYLQHEFEQAKKQKKRIIVIYNSSKKISGWLPDYMKEYESVAEPFWVFNDKGERIGNYEYIKKALGYD